MGGGCEGASPAISGRVLTIKAGRDFQRKTFARSIAYVMAEAMIRLLVTHLRAAIHSPEGEV